MFSIARGQFESNNVVVDGDYLFCDTECITLKIWSEEKYGWTDPEIERLIEKQSIDLYLLCKNDIDWSYDSLRETPDDDLRESIYIQFRNELVNRKLRFAEIAGEGESKATKCNKGY